MSSFDFYRFSWLTFDCYGTLINWDAGIVGTLQPILAAHGRNLAPAGILELYAAIERNEEKEYRPYRQIMEGVVAKMAARLAFAPSSAELRALPDALGDWDPFPDTVAGLRRLKQHFKLGIVSNTDDDLFARTARRLEVPFDAIVTAQQVRSYKPSLNNFQRALERMEAERKDVLHVAESLYHDIAPANQLGIASVWVNRSGARGASGNTGGAIAQPDLTVPDLKTLANMVEQAE